MKIVIVSGFFNPLHGGHLDMIEAAKELGDKLVVIVNNDKQQLVKKEKIILNEANRLRVLRALRSVDEVMLAIDKDMTVSESLVHIANQYPGDNLVFANGGDRSTPEVVPERDVCDKYNIEMVYGVGGVNKADSSTRINQALGHKK
ncbi:adenylyltransferase/cytidyltransferase family protein [Candidatus Saccharibacteria bacterium]|jgi:glycerol-3-phosphate cytidylyltransferase/D-beta-D-heptose 7-phosphate kinase/D-beta-D-heptose 1-phosphate adenosyltransferase|nr:adenylyltransferase/cytidyltransferase family protein [Candidatus Saccharibacteria bacterium]